MPEAALPVRPLSIMTIQSGTCKGGADMLAFEFFKKLKARGHRIIWACVDDCALMARAVGAGFEVFPVKRKFSLGQCLRLVRFCFEEQVAVINPHDSRGRHMAAASRALGLNSRIIFFRHCLPGPAPFLKAWLDWTSADYTIAVSNAVKRGLLAGRLPESRIGVVNGGIDIPSFEHPAPEKIELARRKYSHPGVINIGIVARFHKNSIRPGRLSAKRHEILFRALSQVSREFNLIAVGCDEDAREPLKKLAAENGLEPGRLTICGFEPDIAPFYKIFDISVLPSPAEGLGLVLAESLAAGTATIGARAGGAAEVITDDVDGFLFTPDDHEDLASKIGQLIIDPALRERFSLNGRQKVKRLFDIDKNALELEKILARVTGR
ncbi:MAG: glycosyltransferase family 4 protein [Actinomycetota bacterium]|nr:glycosyltransferase family 4 protein [Actinomycetota bacterium]